MKLFAASTSVAFILSSFSIVDAQTAAPAGPKPQDPVVPATAAPATAPAAAVNPEAAKKAEQILHMVHKTYAQAQAMTNSLAMDFRSGMGNNQSPKLTFAFDNLGGATMDVTGMKCLAYAQHFYMTRDDVADKYLVNDAKNISTGFVEVFGDQNPVPPPAAFHDLNDLASQLKSLTMGRIESPQLVDLQSVKSESGASMHEIHFTGQGGSGKAHVTAEGNLLTKVMLDLKPVGAPAGMEFQVTMTMEPKILDKLPQPIIFDPGARKAVKSIDELEPTPMSVGEAAPDFTLSTLSGDSVTLSKLQGSVVVLDFWATWCGPCKRALPELQKFSEWAADSGKPIKVFAVDVWEREQTPEAKLEKVKKFWEGAGYTVPTLMDLKDEVAKKYGFQSIPTTLVIAPNGKLFKLHSGYSPEMVKMLQADVEEALNAK